MYKKKNLIEKGTSKKVFTIVKKFILIIISLINLDSITMCESIEKSDPTSENCKEVSWCDWCWNNKFKILIVTTCLSVLTTIYFFYGNGSPPDINTNNNITIPPIIEVVSPQVDMSFLTKIKIEYYSPELSRKTLKHLINYVPIEEYNFIFDNLINLKKSEILNDELFKRIFFSKSILEKCYDVYLYKYYILKIRNCYKNEQDWSNEL